MTNNLSSSAHSTEQKTNIIVSVCSIIMGIVFLFSAIGKILLFSEFGKSMFSVLHISFRASLVLTALIIVIEICGGIALILRYRVVLLSGILSTIIGSYLAVLSITLMQNKEILYCCFGLFDRLFTDHIKLMLNIIILNALILLGTLAGRKQQYSTNFIVASSILLMLALYTEYDFLNRMFNRSNYELVQTKNIISFVEQHTPTFANFRKKNRVVFIVNYADFSCPPCFEGFMTLSSILHNRLDSLERGRIVALFREDEIMNTTDQHRLIRWKKANDFDLPLMIVSNYEFDQMNNGKSSVLVVDAAQEIIFRKPFPLSVDQINDVIETMD